MGWVLSLIFILQNIALKLQLFVNSPGFILTNSQHVIWVQLWNMPRFDVDLTLEFVSCPLQADPVVKIDTVFIVPKKLYSNPKIDILMNLLIFSCC